MFIRPVVAQRSWFLLVGMVLAALGWVEAARAAGFEQAPSGLGSEDRD